MDYMPSSADEGSYIPPPLYKLFFIYMFNDDINMCLHTCFLRAVCVCMWRGEGGGVSHRMWLCPVWGRGDVNAVTGSLVQLAEFTAKKLKEL